MTEPNVLQMNLSTVTTPLNVIVEMYIAGLEAKLQALRALVK